MSQRWLGALGLLLVLVLPPGARADHAYVSNEGAGTVSVIDTDTLQLVRTVAVGKRPRGLRLSHDGARLYVAVSGVPSCGAPAGDIDCDPLKHDLFGDGVAVVDTRALKVLRTLQAGSDPQQLDPTPEGRRVFVTNADGASVSVVDGLTGNFITRISVGRGPEAVRISPDGAWAFAVSATDGTASLIDTHLLQLARTVSGVGQRPRDATFSADSRAAYVLSELDASLYRIDIPAGAVQRLVELRKADHPWALALDAPEHRLYVSTARASTVNVIALDHPRVTAEIHVGTRPRGLGLTHNRARLLVANSGSNTVSVIDTVTFRVVQTVPVGRSPWGIAVGY